MPIYEYRCQQCAGTFDVLTSYADRDKAQVCPSCESTRTRVLVSTFASLGGEESGLTDLTPLGAMSLVARGMRFVDGPDEVHRMVVSRKILRTYRSGGTWEF